MVEGPAGATGGVGGTVPDPYVTGRVADVDWAARAGTAERAIVRRHLRRLGGVMPGTRIGRIRWPRRPAREALALALLVAGAPARLPRRRPAARPSSGAGRHDRGGHPHGPAAQPRVVDQRLLRRRRLVRPRGPARRHAGAALRPAGARRDHPAVARRVERETAAAESGGGAAGARTAGSRTPPPTAPPRSCWPAAAMSGSAASIVDWMNDTLLDPATGLVRDGVRGGPDGSVARGRGHRLHLLPGRPPRRVCRAGACRRRPARGRRGRRRWWTPMTHRLVGSGRRAARGCDGGDGGLFTGSSRATSWRRRAPPPRAHPRRLADRARERPTPVEGRLEPARGPVFSADWSRPALSPRPGRRRGGPLRAALGVDGARGRGGGAARRLIARTDRATGCRGCQEGHFPDVR